MLTEQVLNSNVANPSIGEVSLGASLSMGSGCILESNADNASREPDRESASNTAVAGARYGFKNQNSNKMSIVTILCCVDKNFKQKIIPKD